MAARWFQISICSCSEGLPRESFKREHERECIAAAAAAAAAAFALRKNAHGLNRRREALQRKKPLEDLLCALNGVARCHSHWVPRVFFDETLRWKANIRVEPIVSVFVSPIAAACTYG